MQRQLLLTHLCLPAASVCDFYSWLMQYFKMSNSEEIFGTGWYFWTLAVGRLICQLTRTAPHHIIYIKQALISIRALLWTLRLFSLYLLGARRTPGSHSHKWVVKSRYCCFQHWLLCPGLLQGAHVLAGRTASHLHFSWNLIPGAFSILKSALTSFTTSIFPGSASVLQHQSFVLCLVTAWQVFLWERFWYSESLRSWKKRVFGLTHAASILSGRHNSVFSSTRQCSGVLTQILKDLCNTVKYLRSIYSFEVIYCEIFNCFIYSGGSSGCRHCTVTWVLV